MFIQRNRFEEFAGLKLLSEVLFLGLMIALFLGLSGVPSNAYSADMQDQADAPRPRCLVQQMTLVSSRVETNDEDHPALVLVLRWEHAPEFSGEEVRGTLFIDRSDSPAGCAVACRLDSTRLLASPVLTVRIPMGDHDSPSGFHDVQNSQLQARFIHRN